METNSRRGAAAIIVESTPDPQHLDKIDQLSNLVEEKMDKMMSLITNLSTTQLNIMSQLNKAAEERSELKSSLSEYSQSLSFLQQEVDDIKVSQSKDKCQLDKKLQEHDLRLDQLEQRDRCRSLRWFGMKLTQEEERDNTLLAKKIHKELFLPAVGDGDHGIDWRCAIEWAHKIPHRNKSSNDTSSYHIIFKCTSRYVLNTIYNNRKSSLAKFNQGQGKPTCFLQQDCTQRMRDAMQYLRSHSEVNPSRVYLNSSGQICFFRHGAKDGARPEVCRNYIARPLPEMIAN